MALGRGAAQGGAGERRCSEWRWGEALLRVALGRGAAQSGAGERRCSEWRWGEALLRVALGRGAAQSGAGMADRRVSCGAGQGHAQDSQGAGGRDRAGGA